MSFLLMFIVGLCAPHGAMATIDCIPGSANCQEPDAYATNMLQIDLSRKEVSNQKDVSNAEISTDAKDAKADANPEPCCSVYLGGTNKIPVPRSIFDGFPQERITVIPTAGTRIEVNATHAFFHASETITGSFARSTHATGMYEYGVSQQKWVVNPQSIFANIAVGVSERLSVYKYEGLWPTGSLDRVLKEQAERWPFTEMIAKVLNKFRIFLQLAFLGGAKSTESFISVAIDPLHVKRLSEFAKTNNGRPSAHMLERKEGLLGNLSRVSFRRNAPPEAIGVSCLHFVKDGGATGDDRGVYVPLNTKLNVMNGGITSSPLRHFDMSAGITVVSYDEAKKQLMVHYSASSFVEIDEVDHPSEASAAYWLGPEDGQAFAAHSASSLVETDGPLIPDDGRIQVMPDLRGQHMGSFYKLIDSIPVDYNYLFQDQADVCPPSSYEQMKQDLAAIDIMSAESDSATTWGRLKQARYLINVLDCGTTYLRGGKPNSNGVEFLELALWRHFLMEHLPNQRLENLLGWQNR